MNKSDVKQTITTIVYNIMVFVLLDQISIQTLRKLFKCMCKTKTDGLIYDTVDTINRIFFNEMQWFMNKCTRT